MAQALFRTAYTVFIKETQDYGTVLVSPEVKLAASRRYGVLMMIGHPMSEAIRSIGTDVRPGDVFIKTILSRQEEWPPFKRYYLWSPVFHENTLICYVWTFIHMSDVGGRVAGSIAPSNTDITQEGIRVPPRRLYREGILDEDFETFSINTRTGEENWGI